jgi:hypothetical protein
MGGRGYQFILLRHNTRAMKTAMQELIEFIESTNNTPHVNLTIMDKAKKLLEKEKEQIIDAGNACSIKTIVHRENLDKMSEDELRNSLVEDTISHGEDYYNQTYNQNQHIIDIMKADEDDGLYKMFDTDSDKKH